MGGKSTLQGAVLGSKQGNHSGLDLHSWQGLTEVLRRGKESLKDPAAYAEFRNLVLEYAQQGGDPELRKQIDAVIARFGSTHTQASSEQKQEEVSPSVKRKRKRKKKRSDILSPVTEKEVQPARVSTPISTRRISPSFRTPPPTPTQSRKIAEPPAGLPVEPTENNPTLRKREVAEDQAPVSESKSVPYTKASNMTTESEVSQPKVSEEIQTPKKEVGFTQPSVPEPEPPVRTEVKSAEEYKARIAEIKRQVHEQIGNPATLVDSYAERGKEYMMALLSALKATGPGSPESPVAAMARLERAYEALHEAPSEPEKAKEEKQDGVPGVEQAPVTQTVSPAPVKQSESLDEKEESTAPVPASPEPAEPKEKLEPTRQEVSPKKEPETKAVPLPDLPEIKPSATPPPSEKENIEEEKGIAVRRSKLSPASTLASLLINDTGEEKEHSVTRALHEIPPERVASSVHQEVEKAKAQAPEVPKPAETGYHPLNGVDPAKVAVKQSELSSPEVTKALHRLLDEWSLFKNSGLFGIGPGGAEHPLYQKLAPLSMAEVVSGRWEGSDRKVTANIKEYVNAWRHEQGVAYNIQETFEHFLRRVVLRIQKRQSGQ